MSAENLRVLGSGGNETVTQAQLNLADKMDDGADCPCCGQMVKIYRRKLNSHMAHSLLVLVRLYADNPRFYHVDEIGNASKGGDFAKLAWWGLIEQNGNDDPDKRTSGEWVPTANGIGFAHRVRSVPAAVLIYNNQRIGYDNNDIDIREALGSKFSYAELMAGMSEARAAAESPQRALFL